MEKNRLEWDENEKRYNCCTSGPDSRPRLATMLYQYEDRMLLIIITNRERKRNTRAFKKLKGVNL